MRMALLLGVQSAVCGGFGSGLLLDLCGLRGALGLRLRGVLLGEDAGPRLPVRLAHGSWNAAHVTEVTAEKFTRTFPLSAPDPTPCRPRSIAITLSPVVAGTLIVSSARARAPTSFVRTVTVIGEPDAFFTSRYSGSPFDTMLCPSTFAAVNAGVIPAVETT